MLDINGSRLPKNLWAETIIAACYINNQFSRLNNTALHKISSGTKPEKREALDDLSVE